MTKPVRIQLRHRMNLQRVSREINGLPAVDCTVSPYANPFRVTGVSDPLNLTAATPKEAVRLFIADRLRYGGCGFVKWLLPELRGKNLACSCPPGPCHVDALLRAANKPVKRGKNRDLYTSSPCPE